MVNNPVLNRVRQRLWRENRNWLCAIYGETGSGKSYSALNIANYIDHNFTLDKVFFSCKNFIRALNQGKLRKGSCCVLDEAGISFGNRDWMKAENKNMSYLLQSFRHMNLALVLTLPSISFLDVSGRKLLHALIQTMTINREAKHCIVKYYNVRWNDNYNDFTKNFPVLRLADGTFMPVDNMRFGIPPLSFRRAYERRKKKYLAELNAEIETKIAGTEKKQQPKGPSKRELILQDLKAGLDDRMIAKKHKTTLAYVRENKYSS